MYQKSCDGPTTWSHARRQMYHFGTYGHGGASFREFWVLVALSTCNLENNHDDNLFMSWIILYHMININMECSFKLYQNSVLTADDPT